MTRQYESMLVSLLYKLFKGRIFKLSLDYSKTAMHFLYVENSLTEYNEMMGIYDYALRTLWHLPTNEYNIEIWQYGDDLTELLREVEGTPDLIDSVKYEARVKIVMLSIGYFSALFDVMKEGLKNECRKISSEI